MVKKQKKITKLKAKNNIISNDKTKKNQLLKKKIEEKNSSQLTIWDPDKKIRLKKKT